MAKSFVFLTFSMKQILHIMFHDKLVQFPFKIVRRTATSSASSNLKRYTTGIHFNEREIHNFKKISSHMHCKKESKLLLILG